MKMNVFVLTWIALLLISVCKAQQKPIKIVLLGSYHLSGMTPDKIKVQGDSILGLKRQQEVDEIVSQLVSFNPQHIFVESTERWTPTYQRIYREYQPDNLPKERWIATSEMFQFGVKTAYRLNLKQGVLPVDWQQPFTHDTSQVLTHPVQEAYRQYYKAAQSTPFSFEEAQTSMHKTRFPSYNEFMANIPNLPLKETLLTLNSDQTRKFLYYTNVLIYMDNNPKGIGTEFAHTQNFRNMKVYQNILKHMTDQTERCLVIYGVGHIQALRSLFESNPRFEIVEVSAVLK